MNQGTQVDIGEGDRALLVEYCGTKVTAQSTIDFWNLYFLNT
jgi:hypothetical protein